MMVKIDRSTITKNPDAGKDHFYVSGPWQGTFEIEGIYPAFMKDDNRFIVRSWRPGKYYEGAILSPAALDVLLDENNLKWFRDNNCKLSYSVNKNIQQYPCKPQEAFLYKHENPQVTCGECGQTIGADQIETDVSYTEDGDEIYCDQVCPKCHQWDTFGEIEYESIYDAVKDIPV